MSDSQDELERLAVNILYPSKEGGTTVSMKRVREAAALIDKAVTEAKIKAELSILDHLLRPMPNGDEANAHQVRLRVIQMQGSALSRIRKGRLRREQRTNQPERSKE